MSSSDDSLQTRLDRCLYSLNGKVDNINNYHSLYHLAREIINTADQGTFKRKFELWFPHWSVSGNYTGRYIVEDFYFLFGGRTICIIDGEFTHNVAAWFGQPIFYDRRISKTGEVVLERRNPD